MKASNWLNSIRSTDEQRPKVAFVGEERLKHTLVHRSRVLLAALACSALFVSSCLGPPRALPKPKPLPEVVTVSGVHIQDLALGRGPIAQHGDTLVIDYTMSLPSGSKLDSTHERGTPQEILLGKAPIRGLDDGLIGVQKDTRRRIVIPPEMAYGKQGVEGLVPPDATLEFEVLVIEVRVGEHKSAN